MDETVLKVAFAGLMHDIGKLVQGSFFVSDEYRNNNADLYQPSFQGRHTHQHAVYTAAFIEQFEKLLPQKFNRANWGLDDSFINLAAGHHKPETPLQWIIAVADRVSSGWDREEFDQHYNRAVAWVDYKKTRLLPLFEKLMHEDEHGNLTSDAYAYGYPLKEVSPDNIFPGLRNKVMPDNNDSAEAEYKDLCDRFISDLGQLHHKEENLELWLDHFESLFMMYSTSVPAARAGHVIPDVSLYDHAKAVAALAVALYVYHRTTGSMTVDAIKDYSPQKFLLISGDFYGIQNFIFSDSGDVKKNRSKILRGRSFAVSLFSELAADMLCREAGLPSVSIVLNAAGKFTLIAPNTKEVRNAIETVESSINTWLMKISYGESSLGISRLEASPADFVSGRFVDLWDTLTLKMEKRKYRKIDLDRFGGPVEGYLDSFHNDLNRPLCPFCGKRPSSNDVEGVQMIGGGSSCQVCRDHIFLGTNLVKNQRIAITISDASFRPGTDKLLEPIFGRYQVAFPGGGLNELARNKTLLKYWDISIPTEGTFAKDVTAKFINGYVPAYSENDLHDEKILSGEKREKKKLELIDQMREGDPKTFGHIAAQALNPSRDGEGFCGLSALGVMKADVDNLGMLMACGLGRKRFTLSRLATLSRQVHWFFALYLPHLLKTDERFQNIYTVFGGGDDLFLIGPWNSAIELTGVLRKTFAAYVCENKDIHFSAGISIHKPHVPLEKLAESSERALEQSKDNDRNRITIFSETVTWDAFDTLQKIKKTLKEWREGKIVNNAMIYRLNYFIDLAAMEKQVLQEGEILIEDMECLKWPALFCYTTERNVGKKVQDQREGKRVREEFSQAALWLKEFGGNFKIALWDVIYNNR